VKANRIEIIEAMRQGIADMELHRGEGHDEQIDEMKALFTKRISIIETARERDLEKLMIRWCKEDMAAGRCGGDQPS